jgi:hypothetical protein
VLEADVETDAAVVADAAQATEEDAK